MQPFARTIEGLAAAVIRDLSPRRRVHVMGVTHTVCTLAALHGLDLEHAAMAGLLHDLSKELPPEQLRAELEAAGIPIPADDLPFPRTWHGLHAAAFAPERWQISRPEVLEAVKYHTTGDARMAPLSLALFVADFCEPNRSIAEAPAVFAAARRNLEEGFRMALDLKTRHMLSRPSFVLNPRAVRAMHRWLGITPQQAIAQARGHAMGDGVPATNFPSATA